MMMANAHQIYVEQLQSELRQIPEEYMPALIDIVHAFRTGVTIKPTSHQKKAQMLKETKEGLADLEADRLVDGTEVMEWLDSWGAESEGLAPKQ